MKGRGRYGCSKVGKEGGEVHGGMEIKAVEKKRREGKVRGRDGKGKYGERRRRGGRVRRQRGRGK